MSDLASTKTGFKTTNDFRDFEFKKENLLELLEKHNKVKEYKATTKGKFNDFVACGAAQNFTRDISWIKKANPEAADAEKIYMEKDLKMIEEKRFGKLMQAV